MRKKIKISPLCSLSSFILKIGLPLSAFAFLYIFILLINTPKTEMPWLSLSIPTMLEYGIMSFTIVFCGALLADIAVKRK